MIHYEPRIELSPTLPPHTRQVFSATRIEVVAEEGALYLQVAEDLGDTTVHSLLFAVTLEEEGDDGSELYVEFNDQHNGMFRAEVGTVELSDDELILTPAAGVKLCAGRVPYAAEVDPFDGPAFFPQHEITQIAARFADGEGVIGKVHSVLRRLTEYGVGYRPGFSRAGTAS